MSVDEGGGTRQFALSVDFRGDYYRDDNEVSVPTRFATVLVDGRSNYVGIWGRISDKPKMLAELTGDDFKFYSCHDSCWRSDGMRWIFKTFCEMRDALDEEIKANMPGVKLNVYELNSRISVRPALCFFRPVSFEKKSDNDRGYSVVGLQIQR